MDRKIVQKTVLTLSYRIGETREITSGLAGPHNLTFGRLYGKAEQLILSRINLYYMKIKPFTGTKISPDGELYRFKKGVAVVPGVWMRGKKVLITIGEYLELVKQNQQLEN